MTSKSASMRDAALRRGALGDGAIVGLQAHGYLSNRVDPFGDGMYGIFWELRFKAHERYPVRAYRGASELQGSTASFRLFGPTCDGSDALPGAVDLPADIAPGDYLEFGRIGAYSLGGRTRFNGHYSDKIVTITGPGALPPGAIDRRPVSP